MKNSEVNTGVSIAGMSAEDIAYTLAHSGLFRRAPVPESHTPTQEIVLWRNVLDRAVVDYNKGPKESGEELFKEVSCWVHDTDGSGDFSTVCGLSGIEEDTAFSIFMRLRYNEPDE